MLKSQKMVDIEFKILNLQEKRKFTPPEFLEELENEILSLQYEWYNLRHQKKE